MTHETLVQKAVAWLRGYGCGVVLSEQSCTSGETPDAIGWKRACHSVVVECKASRADFLVDREKFELCVGFVAARSPIAGNNQGGGSTRVNSSGRDSH